MIPINIVQSDFGYNINFSLQDLSGGVFNLTGYTSIFFRVQKVNNTTLQFTHSMVVQSAINGTCYYTVQAGDFPLSGIYNAQIQVNFASETVTFPDIQLTAIAKLPTN